MPIIQPVTPTVASRLNLRADPHPTHLPLSSQTPTSHPVPGAETGDKAVPPAAPPSAVQMQIKAMITEQVQTPERAEPDPEDPS